MKLKSPRTLDARTLVRPRWPVAGARCGVCPGVCGFTGVAGSPAHRLATLGTGAMTMTIVARVRLPRVGVRPRISDKAITT
jgi:hypothetical protein